MSKNPFKAPSFLELQRDWYAHLENNGFNDIEQPHADPDRACLKRWDSHYFTAKSHGFYSRDLFLLKHDYYYYAHQFLEHFDGFTSESEREIWHLHCQGWGVRESAKRLNDLFFDQKFNREKVWRIVKVLKVKLAEYLKREGAQLNKSEVLTMREYKKEDEAFVYSTWLQNLYANTRWRTAITRKDFYKYHAVLEVILAKPSTTVRICCLKDDPEIIVGYSVYEKTPADTILHWVFVRADWQRRGIARDLCPFTPTVVTHMTKVGDRIWTKLTVRPVRILLPLSYEVLETSLEPESKTANRSPKKHDTTSIPNNND